jgi:Icc protein
MTTSGINPVSRPVRVVHLTDPHLFATAEGELRGVNTLDTLTRVLQHVRDSDWQADLIAVTGDLVQDDTAAAYQQFLRIFSPLGLPIACIPGNHDVVPLMRSALNTAPFSYCATHDFGNWIIVGIDSAVAGSAAGQVATSELQRLRTIIEASSAGHALVCLHHPPLPMNSEWLDQVGLTNAKEFLDTLDLIPKVRATLSGHVHQDFESRHNGIRVIATPSTCRQFKKHSEKFAVDDKPPAYRRVTLNPDGSLATDLIWI